MTFTKTFHGFVETTADIWLIVEGCRSGILPIVNRRPVDKERGSIKSGTIIVFDESESGKQEHKKMNIIINNTKRYKTMDRRYTLEPIPYSW